MTREEAIDRLRKISEKTPIRTNGDDLVAITMAIQALSQEPCDDAISREDARKVISILYGRELCEIIYQINLLPSVTQKSGKCKECKYFEYDSVAKVDGIPLIVAHEICNKWGDGCKTKEDGYCYLFEPQERSEE